MEFIKEYPAALAIAMLLIFITIRKIWRKIKNVPFEDMALWIAQHKKRISSLAFTMCLAVGGMLFQVISTLLYNPEIDEKAEVIVATVSAPAAPVPEPATTLLLICGIICVVIFKRKK